MMKIAHEAPLSIFSKVQALTDYDYALVHLFEENEEYYRVFKDAVDSGREVILDNSIFELGTAFDGEQYVKWIEKLKPTWYIVPDVLDRGIETALSFASFMKLFPNLPGKAIGVAQGSTFEDFVQCYEFMSTNDKVDKIGLSFNMPWMIEEAEGSNKYFKMVNGRRALLKRMVDEKIINENKPHHLLGCGLPQEFIPYHDYKWIDSVDTSNPVIHGLKNIRYTESGLDDKETVKLFTLIEEDVVDKWDDIEYNIKMFRSFCNG